jgi:hypothetical protein
MPDAAKDTVNCSPIPPFNPDPSKDGPWVKLLPAADRLTYRTAKQTFDQAAAKFSQACATADGIVVTAQSNFQAARDAATTAGASLDQAVSAANAAKDAVANVNDLDPAKVRTDPAPIAQQATDVKAAAAAYQTANGAVTAAQTAYVAAVAALAKLSEPGFTDPASAVINEDQLDIAEANRDVAKATAQKPYDSALNAFYTARFTLYNSLNDD